MDTSTGMYTWNVIDAEGGTTGAYAHGEETTMRLIGRALAQGMVQEIHAASLSLILTNGWQTIQITPAERPSCTRRQRQALIAIECAISEGEQVTWQRNRSNAGILQLGEDGLRISHDTATALLDAGLITGTGHPGTAARPTLRARLLVLNGAVSNPPVQG